MMCNRLTIKVTKFQQSSANCFWAVAKKLPGGGAYKLGLKLNQSEVGLKVVGKVDTQQSKFFYLSRRYTVDGLESELKVLKSNVSNLDKGLQKSPEDVQKQFAEFLQVCCC